LSFKVSLSPGPVKIPGFPKRLKPGLKNMVKHKISFIYHTKTLVQVKKMTVHQKNDRN